VEIDPASDTDAQVRALEQKLSTAINTPNSPIAKRLSYSVARVYNGTFPPVEWPASTSPAIITVTTPPPVVTAPGLLLATTQPPTAMQKAIEALRLAEQNKMDFDALTMRLTRATNAHADALNFNNPEFTTPLPTADPLSAPVEAKEESHPTLGQLIYYAVVNTPQPVALTTPVPGAPPLTGAPLQGSAPLVPIGAQR
jgi:hypothetical protein